MIIDLDQILIEENLMENVLLLAWLENNLLNKQFQVILLQIQQFQDLELIR